VKEYMQGMSHADFAVQLFQFSDVQTLVKQFVAFCFVEYLCVSVRNLSNQYIEEDNYHNEQEKQVPNDSKGSERKIILFTMLSIGFT
jgi:hypothetical protein